MTHAKTLLVLTLAATFVLFQCGSSTGGDVGRTVATAEPGQPTAAPVSNAPHAIGEVVSIGNGATMTVESAARNSENEVVAIVAVDNSAGTEKLTISSMLGFEAKDADGNKGSYALQLAPPEGANTPLDGEVPPGDKLRGYLAYKGLGTGVKLTFQDNPFGGPSVTWDLGQ